MQTNTQTIKQTQTAEYLAEREAVRQTMQKMKMELKKPNIRAVFMRLKDK